MTSCNKTTDLIDGVPPNKRPRLAAGVSARAEGHSSAALAGSSSTRVAPHYGDPEQQRRHKLYRIPNSRDSSVVTNGFNPLRQSPELEPAYFELGAVHLPCQAVQQKNAEKISIHDLSERVVPFGFHIRNDHKPDNYGDSLHIGNLFDRTYVSRWACDYRRFDPVHVNLDPFPLPSEIKQPPQHRLQAVTLVYCDGSRAPMTAGIKLEWNGTYAQLSTGIKEQCHISDDQQVTLVLLHRNVYVKCVSKDSAHLGKDTDAECKFGEERMWADLSNDVSDEDFLADKGPSTAPLSKHLVAYITPKTDDPDAARVFVYINGSVLPLLVLIKDKKTKSGVLAEMEVKRAIKKALKPAAFQDGPKTSQPALFRASKHGESHHHPFSSENDRFPVWHMSEWNFLCVTWPSAALAKDYDMTVMAGPLLTKDADEGLLAESARGLALIKEYSKALSVARMKPWDLVEELKAAATSTLDQPLIGLSMTLKPASDHPDEMRGMLEFKVYSWKSDCPGPPPHQRLLKDILDWTDPRVSCQDSRPSSFQLKHFMDHWCRGNPHVERMQKEIVQAEMKRWAKLDEAKQRTLPGMMALLQADERPEAEQPEGLSVSLRPYQRQSLMFMLDMENTEGGFRNHLFCQLSNTKGQTYWYSPVLGRLSEAVPPMPRGGILGEEMGLGKTVEVAALVLSHPAPALQLQQETTADGLLISRATLVVCPVTLMGQWADELADKTEGRLKVLLHHGTKRSKNPADLTGYDIVLVTYQTLGLEYGKGAKETSEGSKNTFPPCGSIQWHRIVLDEAHTVKNPNAQLTKACKALSGDKRWCVTGTPVGSDIADLKGQFDFLQLHPFTHRTFFSLNVKCAYMGNSWNRASACTLLYTLSQCMIRHTKLQVMSGKQILQLPQKSEEIVPVTFSQAEQELYMHIFARARAKYHMWRACGPQVVSKKLIQIMSTLLPLRRICSGGILSDKDLAVELPDAVGTVDAAANPDAVCTEEACCICFESPLREPTRTKCNHWFCWECIGAVLQSHAGNPALLTCPLCRAKVQMHDLVKGVNEGPQALEKEDSFTASLEENASTSESKLMALLEELRAMREKDPSAKALVFSQFVSTINWLKVKLEAQGFGYRTISGSMTLQRRSQAIEAFQKDPPTTVFLLSMRCGSVGINLTSANYVFILEPALNPALEEQAIGRAWRMGQQREVTIKKFYVKGSVEERIIEMVQQRKEGGRKCDPSSRQSMQASVDQPSGPTCNQVNVQDIVGSMTADKQNLRMEELDLLFQEPNFTLN